MSVSLSDLTTATFKTTRAADAVCVEINTRLGGKHRYVAARLAIARSLSFATPPTDLSDEDADDFATALRGIQLFGEGRDAAAWLAMIVQRCKEPDLPKKRLQALVAAHWKRGAEQLKDWEESGEDLASFVALVAEMANFSGVGAGVEDAEDTIEAVAGEALLAVGAVALDIKTNERVIFPLNGSGGSPHMATMGGVGSGKTRTAVHILKDLRSQVATPILAFDFKGDLAPVLGPSYEANVVSPPEAPVPLDVLHLAGSSDTAVKTTAARIRDSLGSVKQKRPTGVQSEALREAVASVLRRKVKGERVELADVAAALEEEYAERARKPDELTAMLNELVDLKLFSPDHSPAEFFSGSWIIQLPQDGSAEQRRLIINLTLDALDRWLNSQPDAPTDEFGRRALRHVTMLDEAHVILPTKLPALGNLVRMSRSKGGVVMLVSQSPDDFDSGEEGYLDNMGLTLAFNTQAKLGPTRRIFGDVSSLTTLNKGEGYCLIRSDPKVRKIRCWEPPTA